MRKKLTFLLAPLLAIAVVGCQQHIVGNGTKETVTRTVPEFDKIRVLGAYEVDLHQGQPQHLVITTDNNLIPYIQTKVEGHTLIIQTKRLSQISSNQLPVVDVTVPKLEGIAVVGAGVVVAEKIQTDDLNVKIMGTSKAALSGNADKVDIAMAGNGQLTANALKADEVNINLVGSGAISVYAAKKLTIKLSGSGKVQYYGEPREIEQKIAGSGEVTGIPLNAEKNPS